MPAPAGADAAWLSAWSRSPRTAARSAGAVESPGRLSAQGRRRTDGLRAGRENVTGPAAVPGNTETTVTGAAFSLGQLVTAGGLLDAYR